MPAWSFWAVAVSVVSSAPLGEQDQELRAELRAAVERSTAFYRRLAFAEAIQALQRFEATRQGLLACPENTQPAAELNLWLGALFASANDRGRARERFTAALDINPRLSIDRSFFPPPIISLYEEVRSSYGSRASGGFSVSTEPPGAEVFLDGKRAGTTPLTVTAGEGEHAVCIRHRGHHDWAARLRVTAGRVDSHSVFLKLDPAQAAAVSARPEVSIESPGSSSVRLELSAAGGYSTTVGTGPAAGLALGGQLSLTPSFALAALVGWSRPFSKLSLVDPGATRALVDATTTTVATAAGLEERSTRVEGRYQLSSFGRFELQLAAGLELTWVAFGDVVIAPPPSIPLTYEQPTEARQSAWLVGPTLGASMSLPLSQSWFWVVTVDDRIGLALVLPAFSTVAHVRAAIAGTETVRSTALQSKDTVRHHLSLSTGVGFRLR